MSKPSEVQTCGLCNLSTLSGVEGDLEHLRLNNGDTGPVMAVNFASTSSLVVAKAERA